ncbi:hypothetical protein EV401DRAFT_1887455 [Pisolithus croceorrhizus]|nr:hypothetical protein EV401DRAFT_1887455 [Pisolithus croceorrhizus]
MRLTFSTDHYQNTSTADEYGRTLYIVSTCGFLNRKTTVHKVNSTPGSSNYLMKLAAIKCGLFGSDKIWFRGRRIQADRLMAMRGVLSSCVVLIAGNVNGSDQRAEVDVLWVPTIERTSGKYTVQTAGRVTNHDQLAKYHQRNLGIRKPSHPPYLEISESLRHMLDHVVMTFIYAEMLSKSE